MFLFDICGFGFMINGWSVVNCNILVILFEVFVFLDCCYDGNMCVRCDFIIDL